MADEKVAEAAGAVAAQGGEVDLKPDKASEEQEQIDQARAAVDASAGSLDQKTINAINKRLDAIERAMVERAERETHFSPADHGHPHDPGVQALIDALGEMDREELTPERKRWWQRRLG